MQRDSVFDPANEIVIQVVAETDGGRLVWNFPEAGRAYQNVNAGSGANANAYLLSTFGSDPIDWSVVMWEYDDGGPMVDAAVFLGTAVLAKGAGGRVGGNVRVYGRTMHGSQVRPNDAPSQASTDNFVSRAFKSAFGTANDLVGTHNFTNMSLAQLAARPLQRENGYEYSIKGVHRGGGANCSTYFRVDEFFGYEEVTDVNGDVIDEYLAAVRDLMRQEIGT